MIEIVYMFND